MRRLKILLSAYACEPGSGSEPGVGWNMACRMAAYHDVWVLTRSNNRQSIEREMERHPVHGLHFLYYDLPVWARWWKWGQRGVQFYYYLWQIFLYRTVLQAHKNIGFDLGHHITFVRYWTPSFVSLLDMPFLWGPVGGGESAPPPFFNSFSFRGRFHESTRDIARWIGEHDPLVRMTARHVHTALATTPQTAERLERLKVKRIQVRGESGLSRPELDFLGKLPAFPEGPFRFISIGRLLHWKGFNLGLEAFAASDLPQAEFWIVGDGPEYEGLKRRAEELHIADRVRVCGRLMREETLKMLGDSHVLVHPSLHDSGGWVCLEAMAAGKPVLCLRLGGPSVQVTKDTGWLIDAITPEQSIRDLAESMKRCYTETEQYHRKSMNARIHVNEHFSWERKCQALSDLYYRIVNNRIPFSSLSGVSIQEIGYQKTARSHRETAV